MNRLKELRENHRLRQKDVADILNLTTGAYCQVESGRRGLTIENADVLADYYKVSIDYLLGKNDVLLSLQDMDVFSVPIVGAVLVGKPITDYETAEGYISMPKSEYPNVKPEWLVALRAKDDSMAPQIFLGDVVIIRTDVYPENGMTALYRLKSGEFRIRVYKKTLEGVTLMPANPAYRVEYYSEQEISDNVLTFCGVIIESRRSFYKSQYL